MTIVEINSYNIGSTGNVMLQIAERARAAGHNVYICVPKSHDNLKKDVENRIFIGNILSRNIHIKLAYWTGLNGCFSFFSTLNFIRKLNRIKPNLIHIHNLHNCYINLPLLFRYIKKQNIPVIWTLHDCWAFTGQCPHFTITECNKWKTQCYDCPSYREYPQSRGDHTKIMWKLKKKWFLGVSNLTIVTPSQWLANLVKESFLNEYSITVINNGINIDIFKPRVSDFRFEHNISEEKFMLLGVSYGWTFSKGIDVFVDLAKRLDKDKYQIVLVGTDEALEGQLPSNIIAIRRTQNQMELAEIYSAADLFVNPTRQENYPTVNMESIACGTPVLTFNTGGSPETINEDVGRVTVKNSIDEIIAEIEKMRTQMYKTNKFLEKAHEFDQTKKYIQYVNLYEHVCKNGVH